MGLQSGVVLYSRPDLSMPIEPCIDLDIAFLFGPEVELLYEATSFLVEKRRKIAMEGRIVDGAKGANFCKLRPSSRSLNFDFTAQCDSSQPVAPGSSVSVDELLVGVNKCLDSLLDSMFPATDEPPADDYPAPAECPPTPPDLVGYDVDVWCQVV